MNERDKRVSGPSSVPSLPSTGPGPGGSQETTGPDEVARKARAAEARKAVKGYFNAPAVEFALKVSEVVTNALYKLIAEKPSADQEEVFLTVTNTLTAEGLDQHDRTLVALAAVLSHFHIEQNILFTVAAQYKSREGEKGLFANLLGRHMNLTAPAFFALFEILKKTNRPTTAQQLQIVKPRPPIAAPMPVALPLEPPESEDPTDHEALPAAIAARSVVTIADVMKVLTNAPINEEAVRVKNVLHDVNITAKDNMPTKAATLLEILNDPARCDLSTIAQDSSSPWYFLWEIRAKLWLRTDLGK